jgi:hypothetical protein
MTAVAVELLPDPPAPQDAPDPDAVTLVADTDKLMTMCSCAADALTLAGGSLAHTDWMPDNILIAHGRAWLVDWAWPTPPARGRSTGASEFYQVISKVSWLEAMVEYDRLRQEPLPRALGSSMNAGATSCLGAGLAPGACDLP